MWNLITRALLHRRMLLFVLLPGWCAMLYVARFARTGTPGFSFLVWNLVLAAVPALASMMFVRADRGGAPGFVRAAWFALWLLFLPNAPYIVTDFVHLRLRPPVPFWFDIALLFSFAISGLAYGYASVADVQGVIARRRSAAAGWALAVAALLLSGFGIYLGRFVRWNSWDAVAHPHRVLEYMTSNSLEAGWHPRSIGVTLVYGVGLVIGYVVLHSVVPHPPRNDERP